MSAPLHTQAVRAAIDRPGQWLCLTLSDGREITCRLARAIRARSDGRRHWYVDHGAYGSARDDAYVPEDAITSARPVARPPFLLSYRDPHGVVKRVGWYATERQAALAIEPRRALVTDVRIEKVGAA
jgi:hypothetical protein